LKNKLDAKLETHFTDLVDNFDHLQEDEKLFFVDKLKDKYMKEQLR
jgi:hypothetical protein